MSKKLPDRLCFAVGKAWRSNDRILMVTAIDDEKGEFMFHCALTHAETVALKDLLLTEFTDSDEVPAIFRNNEPED